MKTMVEYLKMRLKANNISIVEKGKIIGTPGIDEQAVKDAIEYMKRLESANVELSMALNNILKNNITQLL